MGEIDTKPIEPVQVALSLFGEKADQRRHKSPSNDSDENEEHDVESLLTNLANYKLQLEVKNSVHNQAFLKLEHYQKIAEELSTMLKDSEVQREKILEEYTGARTHINELESKMKNMVDQLSETARIREQLLHVLNELKVSQEELLRMETELAAARELQFRAMTQAELMENAANMEKEKVEELLRHVSEKNDDILMSKMAADEAEKGKCKMLSEINLAKATAAQAQKKLESVKEQMEMLQELENQLLDKSEFIDLLQLELKQSNELLGLSDKATSDAMNDLKQLKADNEVKERENSDGAFYIEVLEMEQNRLTLELKNANEEIDCLKTNVEMLTDELDQVKTEMKEIKERETEAQVEIAMLKSELHKGRSKIAAAEAAEARAHRVKSGFCLAVQELAVEADISKKENQKLNQEADKVVEESESETVFLDTQVENSSQDEEIPQADERKDEYNAQITISLEEYEFLIKKADKIPLSQMEDSNQSELENLKKELEVASAKIRDFRNRTEQAVTRADAAEKAKAEVEDQLRKWEEHRQKRKAALAALREVSVPKVYKFPTYEMIPSSSATYQPLGKVLNMKF